MPLISQIGRKKLHIHTLLIAITTILWIGVALHLFPVWWMIKTSITPTWEVFDFPSRLWPSKPTLVVYKLLYRFEQEWAGSAGETLRYPLYVYIKNSCIMSFGTMALQIPITALAAYALSKLYSPRLSRIVFIFFIGTMFIPFSVRIIPNYLILAHFPFPTLNVPKIPFTGKKFPNYNFLNTYWAVILPAAYNGFNLLLLKGFFDGIPDSIIHAARIDGASELSIFRRIIFPMSKAVFAVVAYFSFSAAWNQFMWPLAVLQEAKLWPLSVLLYQMQAFLSQGTVSRELYPSGKAGMEAGLSINGLMGVAIIESIPVFIAFLVFREQPMKGIKLRGFK